MVNLFLTYKSEKFIKIINKKYLIKESDGSDDRYNEAAALVSELGQKSISLIRDICESS